MKIIKAEAISIDIPIKAPLMVSGGVNLDFARDIIVKITDEKGNTGCNIFLLLLDFKLRSFLSKGVSI